VQRMSAGTGIRHSEYNASQTDPVHFLQIWILPAEKDIEPGYEQKTFTAAEKQGQFRLVGSRDGREGSITIHQDVDLYAAELSNEAIAHHTFTSSRVGWVQVARGSVKLNDQPLNAGDGAAIAQENAIAIQGITPDAEVLLFDMRA
jgi:quercetin 2,3-dioxygenase